MNPMKNFNFYSSKMVKYWQYHMVQLKEKNYPWVHALNLPFTGMLPEQV